MSDAVKTWTPSMPLVVGCTALFLLLVLLGGWGAMVSISGAVIGRGYVEIGDVKHEISHPKGGIVAAIQVEEGDVVQEGDVVAALEDTVLDAKLQGVEGELFEVLTSEARLTVQFNDLPHLEIQGQLAEFLDAYPEIETRIMRHQEQLDSNVLFLERSIELLQQRIMQTRDQIDGVTAQIESKEAQLEIVSSDLKTKMDLHEKRLAKSDPVSELRQTQALITGEIGALTAKAAELENRILELRLESHGLRENFKNDAITKLSELAPKRSRLLEERAELLAEKQQLTLQAPVNGIVHDIQVRGIKSVVKPATPIMHIVPGDKTITALVKIDANDVDQVGSTQPTSIRFHAFNNRMMPIVLGEVARVSPDVFLDPLTQKPYYEVAISFPEQELMKLETSMLVRGMPVSAFIETQSQTPLEYVTRPIRDYFLRAFRDI